MYFYQTTYYKACRNNTKSTKDDGLELTDCKLANQKPAVVKGLPIKESPTSMPQIVVDDPKPILQHQNLPLPMR